MPNRLIAHMFLLSAAASMIQVEYDTLEIWRVLPLVLQK